MQTASLQTLGNWTATARTGRTLSDARLAAHLKTSVNDIKAGGTFSASTYEDVLCQLCRTTQDVKAVAAAIGLLTEGN
jgi:hypothetical protein